MLAEAGQTAGPNWLNFLRKLMASLGITWAKNIFDSLKIPRAHRAHRTHRALQLVLCKSELTLDQIF